MIAPRCTSCGRTVLELRGQFARFDSLLTSGDEPPADSAGTWHVPCLERSGDVGPRWHAAIVRNLVDVRRYQVLGRADGWVAVRSPTGEPQAISPLGVILPLRFRARPVPGGVAGTLHEAEYNLELADRTPIARLQATLRAHNAISLVDTYEALGIADCLVHAELQTDAAFRLEDPDVADDWSPQFVCAAVTYSVMLPDAIAAFVTS